MPFDDERILQDYLARLLTLQDERADWLDADDLKAAARDLGLSDAELERLDAVADAHRQRGKQFSRHGAWDEALAEYRQATALRPFDVPLLHERAVAHASRYQATRAAEDREAAERYARRCIDLDPRHTPSYDLLTALKGTPPTVRARPEATRLVLAAAVGVLVLAAGLVFFFAAQEVGPGAEPPPTVGTTPKPSAEPPAVPLPSEREIPIRLDAEADAGLRLDVQRSRFTPYDTSYAYTLHATLHNTRRELHRLRLQMDLLDAEGLLVHTRFVDARSDHEAYLRPGDVAPLAVLVYEKQPPPRIQEARLSVNLVEREPAAADYGAAAPLPLAWAFPQPAYLDVAVYERESRLSDGFRERMHFLTLAVRNQGTRSVQRLRLQVTWFDPQDNELTSETRTVVSAAGPAMRADQTWVARVIGKFPPGDAPPFARYTITAVEAE